MCIRDSGKVGYGLTVLAISKSLYTGFKDGLGINATNFLWYTPVQFTGGPWYNAFNAALGSGDAMREGFQTKTREWTGRDTSDVREAFYTSKQDWATLKKSIPRLVVPGSSWGRSQLKAIAAAEEGDYHAMFLNGMSAPVASKNF